MIVTVNQRDGDEAINFDMEGNNITAALLLLKAITMARPIAAAPSWSTDSAASPSFQNHHLGDGHHNHITAFLMSLILSSITVHDRNTEGLRVTVDNNK